MAYSRKRMQIDVQAYAGYQADERPLLFRLAGREYQVDELLDKWYGPDETWFKVRANDGGIYILRVNATDEWTLESYRHVTAAKPFPPPEQGPVPFS